MRNYELGKIAALEGIAGMIDGGMSLEEILDDINDSLSEDLEKNASDEDVEWMSGAESCMLEFIKEAEELIGVVDEDQLSMIAFDKVAQSINLDDESSSDVYSEYNNLNDNDEDDEKEEISIQEIHERLKTAGYIDQD